jgi:FkbM family methyltransferase
MPASTDGPSFAARLLSTLLEDTHAYVDHVGVLPSDPDAVREPWRQTAASRTRDLVAGAAGRIGFSRQRFDAGRAGAQLAEIVEHLPGLDETYGLLADSRSREVLLAVLRFRVLGAGHVTLPMTRRRFWTAVESTERTRRVADRALDTPFDLRVDLYEIPGAEGPIRYFGPPKEVVEFFELEQYTYDHGGVRIAAAPGDVVVDGGGGWGETALYFADAVGDSGRVFCFEFLPDNLEVLERNLEENPRLHGRIEVIRSPLWRMRGERLGFVPAGPVTSIVGSAGDQSAMSEAIDDLRSSRGLPCIDFIKLDVEGAEPAVLEGARETLDTCRPRLAIAGYHRLADLVEIPHLLSSLDYELFLDHTSPGPYETVIFARPRAR